MVNIPPMPKPRALGDGRTFQPCGFAGCHYVNWTGDPNEIDAHVNTVHMRDGAHNRRIARRAYGDLVRAREVAPARPSTLISDLRARVGARKVA